MTTSENTTAVDRNYEAFMAELPMALALHRNMFALMHDEKIVNYYSTWEDAYRTASSFYPDGAYSIQKVTDVPVDLGFFSHAVHLR